MIIISYRIVLPKHFNVLGEYTCVYCETSQKLVTGIAFSSNSRDVLRGNPQTHDFFLSIRLNISFHFEYVLNMVKISFKGLKIK